MRGPSILRVVLGLIVVVALVGLGIGLYNAGVDQGVVQAGRVPAGAAVPYAGYGYGWHPFGFGFGFFGLIFPILFFAFLFILIRAALWGGRGRGRWDGPDGGWRAERQRQLAELHRQLHDDEAAHSTRSDPGSAPHPTDPPRP